jgi:hypothetical protein
MKLIKDLAMWLMTLLVWTGIMLMFWYAVFNGDI